MPSAVCAETDRTFGSGKNHPEHRRIMGRDAGFQKNEMAASLFYKLGCKTADIATHLNDSRAGFTWPGVLELDIIKLKLKDHGNFLP